MCKLWIKFFFCLKIFADKFYFYLRLSYLDILGKDNKNEIGIYLFK